MEDLPDLKKKRVPALDEAWGKRKKLRAEAEEFYRESREYYDEALSLRSEYDKLGVDEKESPNGVLLKSKSIHMFNNGWLSAMLADTAISRGDQVFCVAVFNRTGEDIRKMLEGDVITLSDGLYFD